MFQHTWHFLLFALAGFINRQQAGFTAHLTKPVDLNALAQVIGQVARSGQA